MNRDLAIELSEYRLYKANDLYSQAVLLHKNKKYDGSINRSYYAVFNATRALLALLNLDSSKHSGVIAFFDRYFVKTGIFDKKFSYIIHSAFDSRQDNDYEDFYEPTEEESSEQLKNTELFIAEIENKQRQILENKIQLPKTDE